jgi:hypothetical protein
LRRADVDPLDKQLLSRTKDRYSADDRICGLSFSRRRNSVYSADRAERRDE